MQITFLYIIYEIIQMMQTSFCSKLEDDAKSPWTFVADTNIYIFVFFYLFGFYTIYAQKKTREKNFQQSVGLVITSKQKYIYMLITEPMIML